MHHPVHDMQVGPDKLAPALFLVRGQGISEVYGSLQLLASFDLCLVPWQSQREHIAQGDYLW